MTWVIPTTTSMWRTVRLLVGLACLAWLAACGTAQPIQAKQTFTGQEGAVVVRLITNGATQGAPAESLSVLNLQRVLKPGEKPTQRDFVSLVRTREATQTTAIFSGMVEPGAYTFTTAVGNQGNMTYTFPLAQRLSRFEVKRGEVSLVGTILVQPGNNMQFFVGYVPPDDELRQSFEMLYPTLAAQTRDKPVNTLERTPELERSIQRAPAFKRAPSRWNGLDQTAEGEFFAGSKLGKVLWRKQGETRWRELDTGSWREVMSVHPYRGGLLAAGEEGMLRLSRDEGRSWTPLAPPDRALIAGALPLSNGKVLALTRRDDRWSAYLADNLDQAQWRKLGEFGELRSINVPWSRSKVLVLKDALAVSMPEGTLYVIDEKSIAKVGSNSSTADMSAVPDGTLVASVIPFVRSTMVSKDRGKTWVDLNTSRFMLAVTFKDAQTAYAVSPIEPGVMPGKFGLMTSRDGGLHWTHTGEHPGLSSPYDVQQLVVDRSNGALIAFLNDDAVVQSTDEGKTWKIVKDR